MTAARVRRVNRGKNHYYTDEHGDRLPGVTTILGNGVPKPALVNWAANATAGWAVDHWDELTDMSPSKRLALLQKARYAEVDRAKVKGTDIHAAAERLVAGEAIDVPDEILPHVEHYARFLDRWQVEPVLVEATVYTLAPRYARRAGTLDLVADLGALGGRRLLLDVKSGRGVYGETALQLAGYRWADYYVDPNGDEQPMVPVEGCGVIHVTADGCDLIPVEAGEAQHKQFIYAAAVAAFVESSRELVGEALEPPESAA